MKIKTKQVKCHFCGVKRPRAFPDENIGEFRNVIQDGTITVRSDYQLFYDVKTNTYRPSHPNHVVVDMIWVCKENKCEDK